MLKSCCLPRGIDGCRNAFKPVKSQSPLRNIVRPSTWAVQSSPSPSIAENSLSSGVWDDKYSTEFGELEYGSILHQGVREEMQDYLTVVPKARCGFLYAGVFDGHGGETAAEYLSENLYRVFSDNVDEATYAGECSVEARDSGGLCCPVELSSCLKDVFALMDSEILKWLEDNQEGEEAISGSTATVVLARKDKAVIANVGDSRAVLCRRGRPQDLSTEHRVFGSSKTAEEETERVEGTGGWVGDGRVCDILAVSRAFGDSQFKGKGLPSLLSEGVQDQFWDQDFADSIKFTGDPVVAVPDVTEIAIKEGDEFIILASDGLWDVVSSNDAVQFVRKDLQRGRSTQECAEKLADIAIRRYSEDNIAVVIIDLGGLKQKPVKKSSGMKKLVKQVMG